MYQKSEIKKDTRSEPMSYTLSEEKKLQQNNEGKMFKIYQIVKYGKCSHEFKKEDGELYNLKQVVKVLTNKNRGYHESLNENDYYIFYGDIDEYRGTLKEFFYLLIEFMSKFYNIKIDEDDIYYTNNKSKKGSHHYSIPKYYAKARKIKEILDNFFQHHIDQFLYKSENKKKDHKVVDTSFCMNGWFRCPNQHKEGEKNTEHIIIKGKMEDFILTNVPENSICIDEYPFLGGYNIKNNKESNKEVKIKNNNSGSNGMINKFDEKEIGIYKRFFDECYEQIRFDYYQYWINVGMAIKNKYGDYGFELFEYFSNKSNAPDDKEKLINKYNSFKENLDKSITVATIYFYAKEDNKKRFNEIIKENFISKYYIKNNNKIQNLVNLLSISRLRDENDWMDIGKCLHNIDKDFLDLWKSFSLQEPKYQNKDFNKLWLEMENNDFDISTLQYWAKIDNYTEYKRLNESIILEIFDNSKITCADDDIAKIFYKIKRHDLVCAQSEKKKIWYLFENGVWNRLKDENKIRSIINKELLSVYKKYIEVLNKKLEDVNIIDEFRTRLESKKKSIEIIVHKLKIYSFVTQIINQSIMYFKRDDFIEKLDSNPDIICFGQHLFDLKNCRWRESLPSDMCSLKCGVIREQINDTNLQLVDQILSDIFLDNEVKKFVVNEMSLFLNGNNPRQLFYIWLGTGANGKSFLTKCLMNAFGNYYTELPSECITGKEAKATQATPFLANARGRRIVVFSEPEEGAKLNNSIMKRLTGGEKVLYRELYGDPKEYEALFKAIILCNTNFELQNVTDDSIPRRLRYVNFKTKFVDDPKFNFQKKKNTSYMNIDFLEKIKGSFMWLLINNYINLKKNGFKFDVPKNILEDQSEFIDDNDEIKVFLKENYEMTDNENDHISCKNLLDSYKNYAKANNKQIKIKEKLFKDRVMTVYPYKDTIQWRDETGKKILKRSIFTNIKEIIIDEV